MTMNGLFQLNPYVRHTPWGGNVLSTDFRYDAQNGAVGEVLDASCLDEMPSRIAAGPYAGMSLPEIFRTDPRAFLGPDFDACGGGFPFLVKRIDAADDLSVQVHPNDSDARRLEGKPNGKSEAWVVLDAKPGATLLLGLKEGVTRADVAAALRERRIVPLMRRIAVKPGDVLPVPAGCVHSIGKGIVVFESQQSVDITYRLYDWDRPDKNGKLRPLHIEQGLQVVDPEIRPEKETPVLLETSESLRVERLVRMPQFEIKRWEVRGSASRTVDRLLTLHVHRGKVRVRTANAEASLVRGDTLLVPASAGHLDLEAPMGADLFAVTATAGK